MSEPNLLLVGPENLAKELAAELGSDSICCRTEPYEALAEMHRRPWPRVVLEARQNDFPALCRASRRLQRDSRLLAVCGVSDEAQVRPLVGPVLDDYFIYPPSPDDLRALRQPPAAPGGGAAVRPALDPDLVSELMLATRNVRMLQERVQAVVGALTGTPCMWVEAVKLPPGSPVLLSSVEGRVLVCPGMSGRPRPQLVGVLRAIERCLPALMDNAARMESLHRLAITDHLTGAYNRRYFYHLTDQILAHAGPDARAALLLYDIDDFKKYNEKFGYAVGDQILLQTANLMRSISRTSDMVARIGGDEFCVLFWEPQGPREPGSLMLQTAYDLAERFRAAVAKEKFTLLGPNAEGSLTISGGLAMFPRDGKDVRELLRSADKAIKSAKKAGKNGIAIVGQ